MKLISPLELSEKRDAFTLIDVRETYEYQFANIGCVNIPMAEVCQEMKGKQFSAPVLLICKSGNRATAVANFLETEMQMETVFVLEGGLTNWVEQVEPTLVLD